MQKKNITIISLFIVLECLILGGIYYSDQVNNVKQQKTKEQEQRKEKDNIGIKNNVIYLSEDNSEYPLILDQTAYPLNELPEVSKEIGKKEMKDSELTPLMSVPDNSWIFNVAGLSNLGNIYFVINSTLSYQYIIHRNSSVLKNPSGGGITILSAYKYSPEAQTIRKLFDTFNLIKLSGKYPAIKSISPEGRYIAFDVYSCWGCGAGHPSTFLYDIKEKTGKDIGQTLKFQWIGEGKYRYKEYIKIPCKEPDSLGCYKEPNKLPFMEGSL
jgi:hypothetical protein